ETYRPREAFMHVHYKLGPGGFNLAKHFQLHFTCVRCAGSNIIHVDISGSRMATGVKIDFRFRTEDGDTAGRRRMVADVAGQYRRCFKSHKRFKYINPLAVQNPPGADQENNSRYKSAKSPKTASAEFLRRQRASGAHQQSHCWKHEDEI